MKSKLSFIAFITFISIGAQARVVCSNATQTIKIVSENGDRDSILNNGNSKATVNGLPASFREASAWNQSLAHTRLSLKTVFLIKSILQSATEELDVIGNVLCEEQ